MKLKYKILGLILGIFGGIALAEILRWFLERKKNGDRTKY